MAGAAALCALGALRTGAGLVTLASPQDTHAIVATKLNSAMTLPLAQESSGALGERACAQVFEAIATWPVDALAIGPGLGRDPQTLATVCSIVKACSCAWVADGDALYALAQHPETLDQCERSGILTPHSAEMGRLINRSASAVDSERIAATKAFCERYPHVLVLKGAKTLVGDRSGLWQCTRGNPGMATGGSGDVLAGMAASLLAQALPTLRAARLAVYLHACAGDLAARRHGEVAMIADDLVDHIGAAITAHQGGRS